MAPLRRASNALVLCSLLACPAAAVFNVSTETHCAMSTDVCTCAAMAPGCGWCSSTGRCAPANKCTTTCRECPATHKTCRSSCRRTCVDTCALALTVCGCNELDGCGWCSHGKRCLPYPECSTTCSECDPTCANHKHCQAKCYARFHTPRRPPEDFETVFPPSRDDIYCALAIFFATVRSAPLLSWLPRPRALRVRALAGRSRRPTLIYPLVCACVRPPALTGTPACRCSPQPLGSAEAQC